MSPPAIEATCRLIAKEVDKLVRSNRPPVVLCSPQIRAAFKQMTLPHLPQLVVLSYNEITRDTQIESLGLVADAVPARSPDESFGSPEMVQNGSQDLSSADDAGSLAPGAAANWAPAAAVLHTREVCGSPWLRWIPGLRQIEVVASTQVNVPSRLPPRQREEPPCRDRAGLRGRRQEPKDGFRDEVKGRFTELQSMVEDLCRRTRSSGTGDLPEVLFHRLHRPDRCRSGRRTGPRTDRAHARFGHLGRPHADPCADRPHGRRRDPHQRADQPPGNGCHLVALVGPTGVGKTTTIAKLAANFRLRDKRKVGPDHRRHLLALPPSNSCGLMPTSSICR